jgi:S-formylglutathione hydrolase
VEHIEAIKEFGGWLNRYRHDSASCHCEMTFSVYLPPQAAMEKVPAVYWLSGLTCTDDNFRVKAGAQRYAAELGLALVIPDTSPRGEESRMFLIATIWVRARVSMSTRPSRRGRGITRCTST